jgi:hypothetical protein
VVQQQRIERLLRRLLEGSPVVLALFAEHPFDERPSKYVRALLYDYRFADARLPGEQQAWWSRRLDGTYYPSTSLAHFRSTTAPIGAGAMPDRQ